MTRPIFAPLAVAALAAGTAALAQTPASAPADAQPALMPAVEAAVLGPTGEKIGTVSLKGGAKGTVVRIALAPGSLPPGWHGAHFHAVGDCSDPGKYEASKAHVNHTTAKHGLLNAEGPDMGDLPNVYAAADGSVNAELASRTLLDGREGLRDGDGSALIFHANSDDHMSQPIGGAGARIACAVIK